METAAHDAAPKPDVDFFDYWDSLGFFDNLQVFIPRQFLVLFNLARLIMTDEKSDAFNALEELTTEEEIYTPNREESIQVNRLERVAPLSDRMEIETFRKITEMKKALPRELALDDDMFSAKLFTKTLLVTKHYESEADRFKPVSTSRDPKSKDSRRMEQKIYILLDRSKSMELHMRTFYSKCLVAEYLRRKMTGKARLYFRSFDTKPGKLFKIEKKEDFPRLIEEVLLTTTGGNSTNLRDALFQAIADINFDKEMAKSEILVVTDGISKVDKNELKVKLGEIKLNVLKIGDELPTPDYFEMEAFLKREGIPVTADNLDLRKIKDEVGKMRQDEADSSIPLAQRRIFRSIFDSTEKIFKDLKEVSTRFIEIPDIPTDLVFEVTPEQLEQIRTAIDRFSSLSLEQHDPATRKRLFRQVQFMDQYVTMLMENGHADDTALKNAHERLAAVKQRMMKDPHILMTFMQTKEIKEDREMMQLAKKEARRLMKQMKLDDRKLSIAEMKKAQVLFTMDVGKGSMGQFIMLIVIRMIEAVKRLFRGGAKKPAQTPAFKEKRR